MPLAGKGMLLTSMDIDPSDEAEFNRWYDREHLGERVAIPGFLEARRYVAHDGQPKYLSLYSTETFEVLDSPAYRTALASQTNAGKSTEDNRPADKKPPAASGGRILITMNTAYARPSRRATGHAAPSTKRAPSPLRRSTGNCDVYSYRPPFARYS